jgi:hypothetical protein
MRLNMKNFQTKREFDRIKIFHWGHFSMILCGFALEMWGGHFTFLSVIRLIIILLFYRLYFQTIANLYYTYWTFSIFTAIFLITGMVQGLFFYDIPGLFWLYFFGSFFLVCQSYLLFSPIYYPLVRWWEYDFRYRHDLKITIKKDDQEIDARLDDLRRDAGRLVSFESFKAGEILNINTTQESEDLSLKVEIMHKRETLLGRGISYGVKFILDDREDKKKFSKFIKQYKKVRTIKKQLKFKSNEA